MKTAWIMNGKVIVDNAGKPIICDECPCQEEAVPCCPGVTPLPNLYYWGYAISGNVDPAGLTAPGCLPLVCSQDSLSGPWYVTYGVFTGGPFSWNLENFSISGSFGCISATLTAVNCMVVTDGVGQYTLKITGDYDPGGPIGPGSANTLSANCSPPLLGCGDFSITPALGSTYAVGVQTYLTTRDPATGILCPDGTILPTTFTYGVTLDTGGTPTLYSCDMVFCAGQGSFVSGVCYQWQGLNPECQDSGACQKVTLRYLDLNGVLPVLYPVAGTMGWYLKDGSNDVYATTGNFNLPQGGNALGNWPTCGGGSNNNPMWSAA